MTSRRPGDPAARVRRALLLLPLVAGVLAMHVLLLCAGAGPDPMAGHAGHGAAPSLHAAATTAMEAVGAVVAEPGPGTAGDTGHAALTVCLAVLAALVGLLLAASRRDGPVAAGRDGPRGRPVARPRHPPPPADLALLHCVSRT